MKKTYTFIFISCLAVCLLAVTLANSSDKRSDNELQPVFVIDNDVNLYKDKETKDVIKKVNFFDSGEVMSDEISANGRINVKLQNGTDGWIEEKYTSYIPKGWKKLLLFENYYCFIFSNKKIDVYKDEEKQGKMYYYSNNDLKIVMGVNFFNNYQQQFKSMQHSINMQIQSGQDKKLNCNREFTFGNYKVNYVITTDHEEGGIEESFDFAKLDELNLKKCYTVGIDYMPYTSEKKKLLWRKMLFSTLQSLK